jgi:hypothetical protein
VNVDRNRTPSTSEFLIRLSVIHGVQLRGIPQAYTTVGEEIASLLRSSGGGRLGEGLAEVLDQVLGVFESD